MEDKNILHKILKKQKKVNKKSAFYNSLCKDIRLEKISLNKAEIILKYFEKKWIYIKFVTSVFTNNKEENTTGIYSKFRVNYVQIDLYTIILIGVEDNDRLQIDKNKLVQTECSIDSDELKLVILDKNVNTTIYIKEYFPNANLRFNEITETKRNLLITEGKTDWKHLKNALHKLQSQGKYELLDFDFFEYDEEVKMGNITLRQMCLYQSLFKNDVLKIFIFDADDEVINKEYQDKRFIFHGNNVYSLLLPIPKHRIDTPLISIENYYFDHDIKIIDSNNRRLYMAYEFDSNSGKHKELEYIYTPIVNIRTQPNHIIDDKVFKIRCNIENKSEIINAIQKKNIALTKNNYALNIMNNVVPFNNVSINNFCIVFDIINEIYKNYIENMNNANDDKAVEISKGIYLDKSNYKFWILSIEYGGFSTDKALAFKSTDHVVVSLELTEDMQNILIIIIFESNIYKIPINITDDLINFLKRKEINNFNRVELNIYDNNMIPISRKEIFNDEITSVLIGRVLDTLTK